MQDRKKIGAYYTPEVLSNFMVKYVLDNINKKTLNVLEPSVGNGIFISSLINHKDNKGILEIKLTLIDIQKQELKKATKKAKRFLSNVTSNNIDFLFFNKRNNFSLIIGNPPYIKKKFLNENQKIQAKTIHKDAGLSEKSINNIWTSFVLKSISLLEEDGILAFVLPADLLQVKYAEKIREYLENSFERIDIFIVNRKYYSEIDQRIILLFGFKTNPQKGVFFYDIMDADKYLYKQISSNGLKIANSKWNHYLLTKEEINLLNSIYERLPKVDQFISSNTGIVTGANNYFIVTDEIVKKYSLEKFILPIVKKGTYVNGSIVFTNNDFEKLTKGNKPTFLLRFNDKNNLLMNSLAKAYIKLGEDKEINKRYKCSIRNVWYCIPNIKENHPSAFFFKRSHHIPKLIVNETNTYVTDSAYEIYPLNNINIKNFTYSFYNIITFIYAELIGRKYGGGVLELTPNEFKKLPILYIEITTKEFYEFNKQYSKALNKTQIIISKTEKYITENKLFNKNDFIKLVKIYSKLIGERLNTVANT